ncbi:MAG TPA: rhodanese-like domain-containing protein [Gaiellaceae bacterium]|nr:rhodanese-like domain-containing protein [Gaiellaceae bacterium]
MSDTVRDHKEDPGHHETARSIEPQKVWALLQGGGARLLDLRTEIERRRYGAPPGAIPVSMTRHVLKPEGEGAIYLCQHAVRSKATLRNGAAEVAGGFVAWRRAGLPIENVE